MMQMSLKQGLKKWGKRAEEGAMKEMHQLNDLKAFFPRDPKTLTREQRVRALSSLIFLKEKDSDSVFITGAINACENRDVATMDLPGAFLNTVTDEVVIMVLKDELCELMCKVNPKLYRRYVTYHKKGNPVLYVQLYKALYGLMRSALLFYRKLKKELEDYGFVTNPYDPCVANKITKDGNQHTVVWHVDDMIASHVDKFKNTKLISYLMGIYGRKMTVRRGKQH
jgi:hypothetical protein